MKRKINFGAGPAMLPATVIQQMAEATVEYCDSGMSVLELPHREKLFNAILEEANALVRELCGIGKDYEVLWMHGGGRQQFCMVPMNFLGEGKIAAYIDSGHWANEAAEYAAFYGETKIVASSQAEGYNRLPQWPTRLPAKTAYLHITTNNTIYGTQWHDIPNTSKPLIADMSSDIFCCKRDYTQYALFYAAAQKNLGVPGVALAVVHKDLLKKQARELPPMLSYKGQVAEKSVVNTANVPGIYTSLLMLRWIKQKGIAAIEKENKAKAKLLYNHLDKSKLFIPRVKEAAHRSIMNVCFTAHNPQHEAALLRLCAENNITGIKGHRHTGGFRVSLYNAISLKETEVFVGLMKEFEKGTKV
jgi:phosphoserine aminotransferase